MPTKVLACVAIGTVPGLPLSGVVVSVVVVEKMAKRDLAVVVQHGHVVAETGFDPISGVDFALGKGEGEGPLINNVIPILGLAHHLNVEMRTG